LFGQAFINRWMGPSYAEAYWVMVILLVGRMIGFANHPLNSALYAANKHKIVAKIDIIEVMLNLAISLVLVQYFELIGVALGTMIPLLLLRLLVLPYFACAAIEMPVSDYYQCMVRPIVSMIFPISGMYYILAGKTTIDSYPQILAYGAAMAFIAGIFGLKCGFTRREKDELRKIIPGRRLKALL
ncbi:MAG: polysaccharide biosynthesis C-terminal domain-containing protein, partial [Lentilitoribacter sp.]